MSNGDISHNRGMYKGHGSSMKKYLIQDRMGQEKLSRRTKLRPEGQIRGSQNGKKDDSGRMYQVQEAS